MMASDGLFRMSVRRRSMDPFSDRPSRTFPIRRFVLVEAHESLGVF
jgi:hypothetical protein